MTEPIPNCCNSDNIKITNHEITTPEAVCVVKADYEALKARCAALRIERDNLVELYREAMANRGGTWYTASEWKEKIESALQQAKVSK